MVIGNVGLQVSTDVLNFHVSVNGFRAGPRNLIVKFFESALWSSLVECRQIIERKLNICRPGVCKLGTEDLVISLTDYSYCSKFRKCNN